MDEGTFIGVEAASNRLGIGTPHLIRLAIKRGELKATPRQRTASGREGYAIEVSEFERWVKARGLDKRVSLPPELEDVWVSLAVAYRLARRTKQNLLTAIHEGKLPAFQLDVGDRVERWQVRLGDLANWFAKPGRSSRMMRPRVFDPTIMAQLERMVVRREAKDAEKEAEKAA